MITYPRPGRCGSCNGPAEQFPSLNWRHLNGPCPTRSRWLYMAHEVAQPHRAQFIPDHAEVTS